VIVLFIFVFYSLGELVDDAMPILPWLKVITEFTKHHELPMEWNQVTNYINVYQMTKSLTGGILLP